MKMPRLLSGMTILLTVRCYLLSATVAQSNLGRNHHGYQNLFPVDGPRHKVQGDTVPTSESPNLRPHQFDFTVRVQGISE